MIYPYLMNTHNSPLKASNRKGFFLVIDGIDGSGKSTQVNLIREHFSRLGLSVHTTTEPSQGDLGVILRKFLRDKSVPAALDALIFAADRIDHISREILPMLDKDYLVICDRYRDSSFVYQSVQGRNQNITESWIRELNKFSLDPDLTLLFDIDPERSLTRRLSQLEADDESPEKFEEEKFQKLIRTGFQNIAKNAEPNDPHFLINVDQTVEKVFNEIIVVIETKLSQKGLLKVEKDYN